MKICGKCKIEKSFSEFSIKTRKSGKIEYQASCKKCQKIYKDNHYRENKDKYLFDNTKRKKENRQFYLNFKKTLICSLCPENFPECLDFHHTNKKDKLYKSGVYRTLMHKGKKAFLEEVSKCQVLCSNCHRKQHSLLRSSIG